MLCKFAKSLQRKNHTRRYCVESRKKWKEDEETLVLLNKGTIQGNPSLYRRLLNNIAKSKSLPQVRILQNHIIQSKIELDTLTHTMFVNAFAKCGSIGEAIQAFQKIPEPDEGSWTTIITGLAQNGKNQEAIKMMLQMYKQLGYCLNEFITPLILRACGNTGSLNWGKEVHLKLIFTETINHNCVCNNALIGMYSKCGELGLACQVFDKMPSKDTVSWNCILGGFSHNGMVDRALGIFSQMGSENIRIMDFAFSSAAKSCADGKRIGAGRQVHSLAVKSGLADNVYVGSSILDMYCKCGLVADARKVFDRIPAPNVVTWTSLIAGYAQSDGCLECLGLYRRLIDNNVKPDEYVFSSVVTACGNLCALEQGKLIHAQTVKNGFESHRPVGNSLVEMYYKGGCLKDAVLIHALMPHKDVVSWTTMIAAYARYGDAISALRSFEEMQRDGVKANNVTFVCVLSSCSHAGLVNEGLRYLDRMGKEFGLVPSAEHYTCVVDLFGRAGKIKEAKEVIDNMPVDPTPHIMGALLGACRIHGNAEVAKWAAERLLQLDPLCAGTHVVLSNIYASFDMWEEVANVRKMMKTKGLKKQTGQSWIEIRNEFHVFSVGDRSHPQSAMIHELLGKLSRQMKDEGYLPETKSVLHDVEDEQKEQALLYHSEKLALAFGLLNTTPQAPIRIIKNLRVCDDCHNGIKFISKIVGREIVVRDNHRFHVFQEGICSCGDYW